MGLSRVKVVLMKLEATAGSPESLSDSDAIGPLSNVQYNANIEINERDINSSSKGQYGKVAGKQSATISFDLEVKGSGTNTGNPLWTKALRAAGFAPTTGASSVSWAPNSTLNNTYTCAVYEQVTNGSGAVKKQIYGAVVSSMSFSFTAGGIVRCSVTMLGAASQWTDIAMPTATYDSTVPPAFLNAGFYYGTGTTLNVGNLSIDLGISAVGVNDVNAANGFDRFLITQRDVRGNMDPEELAVSSFDWFNRVTGDTSAIFYARVGAASGNSVYFSGGTVQLDNVSTADDNGISLVNIPIRFNANGGDNDIYIVTS
jgi:hypothetical protein